MNLIFNSNSYIGGGETFVFNFLQQNPDYKLVCSKDSWLSNKVDNQQILFCQKSSHLNLLGFYNRFRLKMFLRKNKVKINRVFFLNFQDFATYYVLFGDEVQINYYCLHIYDFYYRSADSFMRLIYEYLTKKRNPVISRKAIRNYNLVNSRINGTVFFMDQINYDFNKKYLSAKTAVEALPCVEVKGFRQNLSAGYKILWIGRLVDFKIQALNAMIKFVDGNELYSLTVVGEGSEFNRVIEYKSTDRITFLGKVDYSDLDQVIRSHHIGYGMGISSVLMASYSLPTIIGISEYPNYKTDDLELCFGLLHELPYGDFGSQMFSKNPQLRLIPDVVVEISRNYETQSSLSWNKSLEFDLRNTSKLN